jgi:hypothetical protein
MSLRNESSNPGDRVIMIVLGALSSVNRGYLVGLPVDLATAIPGIVGWHANDVGSTLEVA